MANRSFQRLQALDKQIKIIHGQFDVGTTGAPTLSASKSVGVQSVTRNSAGDYSIVLGTPSGAVDKYSHFFGGYFDIQKSTALGGTSGGMAFQLKGAPTVSTDGTINFIALDKDGAAAEIGNGETVHFMFILKNSALPGVGV
jgi:hypothetical protein|tara:strand:- start:90 stop:515 length:426 start_codon:yes stop_codon:yes gene_type:complete